jgi:hypothetical protein
MSEEARPILPVKEAYKFAADHDLSEEMDKIRLMEVEWDSSYTTTVRRGYIVDLFVRRGLFETFKQQYWPTGDTPWGLSKTRFFLKIRQRYEGFLHSGEQHEAVHIADVPEAEDQMFAAERDLREFLAKNPGCIEKGLRIFEDGDRLGNEFSIDENRGRIDLLAVDASGKFVVIELKLGQRRNKTLGQLLYYMGWVDKAYPQSAPCRGIIIAKDIPPDLVLAAKRVPGVSLCGYNLSVSVVPVAPTE